MSDDNDDTTDERYDRDELLGQPRRDPAAERLHQLEHDLAALTQRAHDHYRLMP